MDKASADLINAVTGSKLKYRAKEGKVNMCKAIDDMRNASREEGRAEGKEETLLSAIKSVMVSFKMNAKQAMEVLQVPSSDQDKYLAKL